MSAQVTEAHIELVRYVLEPEWYGSSVEAKFARLIAESEAKATAELRSEIAELKESILVQQIFSDDRIRANEAEAELAEQKWLKESAVKRAKELTEELAAANTKLLRNESDGYLCELERTRAELAVERARLDWLMAGGVCMVQHSGGFYVSRLHAQVSRAAIDSGMKEVAK